MIYLDTSALVKLIRHEPESDALADWLDDRASTPWVSSVLIEVELPRALRRRAADLMAAVPALVARVSRYEIDDLVRTSAAAYDDPHLRTVDAVHLATAHAVFANRLTAFVGYDERLQSAATALGLPTVSPG